jgi:hypothetical protein
MNTITKLLMTVIATAALASGTTACGAVGSPSEPAPHRSAPATPELAVASCLGGSPTCVDQRGIQPAQIYFSGDNSVSIREITWSSWNTSGATGRGTWYLETCLPNCAQGSVIKYPAPLTLSTVRHGLFTVLAVTLKGKTTIYHYPVPWPQSAYGCVRSPACHQVAGPSSSS